MKDICQKCGTALSTGPRAQKICTTCHPAWLAHCLGCGRTALRCICRAVAPRDEPVTPCGICSDCGGEQIASTRHGKVCPRCQPWVLNECGCGKQVHSCVCADPGCSE